ncbi:alpha-ribazole phosphatase [Lutispora thermophila]|uniref:Alpha-ribazole phosphatase n=1 Tax=Lutispora thermophila DSM 19022 TaxID=1122184 RepID=A0A1M6CFE7_9FIRM|nr:alpha-ribazole phosphatase [Lutispora thermophila]SHI59722.1 alpha-ribazole phosphatase [Lutispora thermophila DSM 19022]
MLKLYIIRHGETDLNKPGVFFGSKDIELNEAGKRQCRELEKAMENIELDVILSSPLKRCMQTAQGIASTKGLKVDIVEEMREMDFGLWEGCHYHDVARLYPDDWKKGIDDWKNMSPTKGECFRDFYFRVKNALEKIIRIYYGKNVALITHGGCMRVMISALLGLKEDGFWNFYFEHGKYSLLEIEQGHCTIKKINCI